jgi:hypothetical protein
MFMIAADEPSFVDSNIWLYAFIEGNDVVKKAVVTLALLELIARREQRRALELMGKLAWDESYDYKAERSRK